MGAEFKIEDGILTQYEGSAPAVTVPDGVTEIGAQAFYRSGLQSLRIPDGVKTIGAEALNCTSLRDVYVPGSVTQIGKDCFGWASGNLYVHTQPESPMTKYVQKEYPKVTLLLDYDAKEEETL